MHERSISSAGSIITDRNRLRVVLPKENQNIIRLHPLSGNEDQICGIIGRYAASGSSEAQYKRLRAQTDPNSEFERVVFAAIYQQGLRLPDAAQELIPEANFKPDFIYKAARVAIFCDGSVHDHPEQQSQDQIDRDNLRYAAGYYVLTFRHDEDWKTKLEILGSLI